MRGAGQNFGVVIETTFETYPATNGSLNYEAQIFFNVSVLGDVIDTINSTLPLEAPLALVTIITANATTLEASFYYVPLKEIGI